MMARVPATASSMQYQLLMVISSGEILDREPASSSWAAQGIRPWKTQEKMSSRLALRRGSMPFLRAISRARPPVRMMATVLLAVQMSARLASRAMQDSPTREEPLRPSFPARRRARPSTRASSQAMPPW